MEKEIAKDYYIDVFPVTNRQYQEFINERKDYNVPYVEQGSAKPYNWNKEKRVFPEGKGNHPVTLVSYEDVEAFCKWRSEKEGEKYRLPDEYEWEKAARGNDGWVYPWGNEFDKSKCNTAESGIGGTTEVTKYPDGASPYNCQDMTGNVCEWTDSWYDEKKNTKVLRGGSWLNDLFNARCAVRSRYVPVLRSYLVGFRCARTL
ncbi:MAG: SUMF1/EgtB/PvdO family nonheme iron enzyme [bacterium]